MAVFKPFGKHAKQHNSPPQKKMVELAQVMEDVALIDKAFEEPKSTTPALDIVHKERTPGKGKHRKK